jgi:hypothetical protein
MNTTSIFVELLVIGFHTLTWIGLLIITIIGYKSIDLEKLLSINLALPILAMTYVLGVAIDRLSDMVFLPCDHRLRDKEKLKAFPEFLIMRFYILGKSVANHEGSGFEFCGLVGCVDIFCVVSIGECFFSANPSCRLHTGFSCRWPSGIHQLHVMGCADQNICQEYNRRLQGFTGYNSD